MRKILSVVLVMVLLTSAVPLAVTPAATYEYEWKIPCDDGDNELTRDELVNAILPYMLGEGVLALDDVGDAAYVYAYWDGKPKTLDMVDRTVAVFRPIERVITFSPPRTRMVIGVGAEDKIVGMGTWSHFRVPNQYGLDAPKWRERFAELKELPELGTGYDPNTELILSQKPDVVLGSKSVADKMQGLGIPVVAYGGTGASMMDKMFKQIEFVGTVLENEEEAEELISYFKKELDKVTEVTSQIPDSEKPRVYQFWGSVFTKASMRYDTIDLAGGILVSKDFGTPTFGGSVTDVSKEQIIDWNPDIIFIMKATKESKFTVEDVLSDPDLQTISAVKNQSVYYTPGAYYLVGADPPRVVWETFYQAKRVHPDKFKDLDLEKEGNELFGRFYGAGELWTEIGTELGFI